MDRWAQYDARAVTLFLNQNNILKIEKKMPWNYEKKNIQWNIKKTPKPNQNN